MNALREREWPVLPLRLDRTAGVRTARQFGGQVDLPSSPVFSLARISAARPSLLVVDQLDAVSLASGRSTEVFDVLDEMLLQARRVPTMRVLLACRQFDLDNDQRLRPLVDARRDDTASVVQIPPLSEAEVLGAVREMGLDVTGLDGVQRELLRSPLNLVLLRAVSAEANAAAFRTTNDLLEQFWRVKRKAVNERRLPQRTRFDEVVARLAESMSASQQLSAPESVLYSDDLVADADVLISEHVLVKDNGRYAFFHESLFDYAFARSWSANNQSVVEFLLTGEQELFRRAQVRQVLTHIRDLSRARFVDEVRAILLDSRVRFHIKDSVFSLLRALGDPTSEELALVLEWLKAQEAWRERLEVVLRTGAWFDRLVADGSLREWLASGDPALQSRAVTIIGTAGDSRPDETVELLKPYRDHPEFSAWLSWVVRFGSPEGHRGLFELILDLVRSGELEDRISGLWVSARAVPETEPVWAVEFLAAWLIDRPQSLTVDDRRILDMAANDYSLLELVRRAADAAPIEFATALLPYMCKVMALAAYGDTAPFDDTHFSLRTWNQGQYDLDETLMFSMIRALKKIGATEPERLIELLTPLAANPHQAAQILLYEGLAAAGAVHADWTADLLLRGDFALQAGYSDDSFWTTRELLRETAGHMDADRYARVEATLAAFATEWERGHPSSRGRASFTLMSGLPADRLSDQGRRRLGELRRKFGREEPEQPRGIVGGVVGPPIHTEATRFMSDEQWLSAMRRYADQDGGFKGMELRGGAHELAQVLGELTKEHPERFSRLALRIDATYNASYLNHILIGLGGTEADIELELICDVIRHAASLGGHELWLSHPLNRFYGAEIPHDLIDILIEHALGHPRGETDRREAGGTSGETGLRDLYTTGINHSRGSNVRALAAIAASDRDGQRAELIAPHATELARDPSNAVLSCVAQLLHALMRWRRDAAIAGFEQLVESENIDLFLTPQFEGLAVAVLLDDPSLVVPTIELMVVHPDEKVRERGAQLAAFAATDAGQDELLQRVAGAADIAVRRGTATVLAARIRWLDEPGRKALAELLTDGEDVVRKAASDFVIHLRGEDLEPFQTLLRILIESPAVGDCAMQLIFALDQSPGDIHTLTLRFADRLLEVQSTTLRDFTSAAAGHAHELGKLVLRAYAQADDPSRRAAILDVIDRLLEASAYGFQEAVDESARR